MKKILGIVLVLVFSISGSVFGEGNEIKRVQFSSGNIKYHFVGEKSQLIGLYTEGINGLPIFTYYIEILEGKNLLEVIKTEGFRDVLKMKRIIDKKYIGNNSVSLKITTDNDKEGYIYDKGTINIIKPILLVSGELGPNGGQIANDWKDIQINVEKGKLSQKYKIDYIAGGGLLMFISVPEMLSTDRMALNIILPSHDILNNNYLQNSSLNNYYIFQNIEEIDFRKIIDERKQIETKHTLITEGTKKAWDYYGIAYKGTIKNPDFDMIDLNLRKAKELIIQIDNELTDDEKERYTVKLTNRIVEFEEKVRKYKESLNIEEKNRQKLEIKSKVLFFKNLILSKKALENSSKGELYKGAVDKRVSSLDDKKIVIFHNLLGKMDLDSIKYKKYKEVLEYMKAKIGLEIWNREDIDKEEI